MSFGLLALHSLFRHGRLWRTPFEGSQIGPFDCGWRFCKRCGRTSAACPACHGLRCPHGRRGFVPHLAGTLSLGACIFRNRQGENFPLFFEPSFSVSRKNLCICPCRANLPNCLAISCKACQKCFPGIKRQGISISFLVFTQQNRQGISRGVCHEQAIQNFLEKA